LDAQVKNRILIVDDERSNLLYLNALLGEDYILYMARDGAEALRRAVELVPDLILLDIMMPGMTGYEVLDELRSLEETSTIPVIFSTGLNSEEDQMRGLTSGADDYINKPFNDGIVRLRVRNQLKIVNQMRALDKRLRQQSLMTTISHRFLSDLYLDSAIADILRTIGEFLDIARVLMYALSPDASSLHCEAEWLNPSYDLTTRIGSQLSISDRLHSLIDTPRSDEEGFCLASQDPAYSLELAPFRIDFPSSLIAPIYVKGKLHAVLEFARSDSEITWDASEISLVTLVASVFSGVFEREAMENIIRVQEISERSSRLKGEFLSRMSHELRTPMNAIIGLTIMARNSNDTDKKDECLDRSAAASRELLTLLEDILDIADLSDGRLQLASSEFSLYGMLKGIIAEAGQMASKKNQSFNSIIDPTMPDALLGDERRIVQLIRILLSNACKFTSEDGHISLEAFGLAIKDDYVDLQIAVTDDGIGIPAEKQEAIFTAFEQGDGGIDRRYSGAGMGLFQAKTILDKMGGEIKLNSVPGEGSSFIFSIRLLRSLPVAASNDSASLQGKTMLIVDDIEINREIVMAILEETGMQFVAAENGLEAVEVFAAKHQQIDVITMDINMPELDGIEATRRIRALDISWAAKVPIIAMTANTNPSDVAEYMAAGMNAHLSKPVDLDEILRLLRSYLS